MRKYEQNIQSFIENRSLVKLYYFDEEYDSIIIANTEKFTLVADVSDFSFNGYMIFVKKYIRNIKYGKLQIFQEKITKLQLDYSDAFDLKWLDLSSYSAMFNSLKNNYSRICIEGATEEVNQFMIGEITDFNEEFLYVRKFTVYARFIKGDYQIPIKDITRIFFDDEYSRTLFDYAKNRKRG
jgi:hypothetical protein